MPDLSQMAWGMGSSFFPQAGAGFGFQQGVSQPPSVVIQQFVIMPGASAAMGTGFPSARFPTAAFPFPSGSGVTGTQIALGPRIQEMEDDTPGGLWDSLTRPPTPLIYQPAPPGTHYDMPSESYYTSSIRADIDFSSHSFTSMIDSLHDEENNRYRDP